MATAHSASRVSNPQVETAPTYFQVAGMKLAVLSVFSFGLYQVYWFYEHWKVAGAPSRPRIWAILLALFSPLSAYFLFRRIRTRLREQSLPGVAAGLLALVYFGLALSAIRLPSPYWLVGQLSFAPLVLVQAAVNRLNARLALERPRNSRYSVAHLTIVVLGAWLWFLVLLYTFSALAE